MILGCKNAANGYYNLLTSKHFVYKARFLFKQKQKIRKQNH